jgi:hypothetical protein
VSKPFRIPDLIPKIDELVEKNKLQPLANWRCERREKGLE